MSLWRLPVDRELNERARWLVRARLAVLLAAAVLIGAGTLFLASTLPISALWNTWLIAMVYNAAFYVITRRMIGESAPAETYAMLVLLQLVCDALALSAMLHFSGGIENPFSTLYLVLVVVSSSLLPRRTCLLYTGLASLAWVALLLLEAWQILPHYNLAGFRSPVRYYQPAHLWAYGLVMTVTNFCVAALASGVVERVRAGETELLDAQQLCASRVEELEALTEQLRRTDEQRSLFMRVVTHELRAPVAAIKSLLQLILTGYVPEERQLEFIAKAEARATEQLEIISDLLDLAHIRQDLRQPQADACQVEAILADVLDMMQPRFEEQGLRVTLDTPDKLPPVTAAQEHIKQIWINLISNAIKYNRPNGEVSVKLWQDDGQICGSVHDTGIGISPEDQTRIFDDFYRTEQAKQHNHQGTGLGLSIVKAILERYDGRIWVESKPGEGSTFGFTLPSMNA